MLIILLNSFSLGILSVLLPYLFIINSFNFSLVYSVGFKTLLTPKLELLTSVEFFVLSILIYLIYYKEYSMNSIKTLLKNLFINTGLFSIGFMFCFLLLQPVLSVIWKFFIKTQEDCLSFKIILFLIVSCLKNILIIHFSFFLTLLSTKKKFSS